MPSPETDERPLWAAVGGGGGGEASCALAGAAAVRKVANVATTSRDNASFDSDLFMSNDLRVGGRFVYRCGPLHTPGWPPCIAAKAGAPPKRPHFPNGPFFGSRSRT